MFQNDPIELISDPTLPDLLLPEEPFYDEIFPIDNTNAAPWHHRAK